MEYDIYTQQLRVDTELPSELEYDTDLLSKLDDHVGLLTPDDTYDHCLKRILHGDRGGGCVRDSEFLHLDRLLLHLMFVHHG